MSRRLALTVTLLATLAATLWVAGDDEPAPRRDGKATAAVDARRAGPARPTADAAFVVPDGEALQRGRFTVDGGDLFPARSWQPPPALSRPAPPPPPTAPPLPFRYQGMLVEGENTVVFLAHGNRTLLARAGDRLDDVYQVESVGPAAVTFVYRPLNERQVLSYGRSN